MIIGIRSYFKHKPHGINTRPCKGTIRSWIPTTLCAITYQIGTFIALAHLKFLWFYQKSSNICIKSINLLDAHRLLTYPSTLLHLTRVTLKTCIFRTWAIKYSFMHKHQGLNVCGKSWIKNLQPTLGKAITD